MRPGGWGMSRMIESAVTDLPEPDSPTIPSVSPLLMCRSMPSTARTMPSSVKKCVFNPLTSRSRSAMEPPRSGLPATRQLAKRLERARDVVAIHVLVGDTADGGGSHRVHLDLPRRAAPDQRLGGGRAALDSHDDDIGLHAREIHHQSWQLRQALAEPAGVVVILRQAVDHALEGHDAGGGDDTRLPHAA